MINSRPSNHLPDPLRRARAFALLVGAAALTCGLAWSEGLSIALIPPLDRPDVAASVGAFARTFGLQVDELTPEQLVNPAVFSPKRYPAAIYTGLERYVYEVFQPGDGAEALLRYLGEGGTLIVSGVCWPFYRPFKWINGSLQRYDGTVPEFRGPKDAWLEKAMTQLNQSATGSLNRFLGLNISGEGTTQFESPDESIEFRVSEAGRKLFPSLPERFPFPHAGDLRFRPASGHNLGEGVEFTAVAEAIGASGRNYGAGICLVDHKGGTLAGGRVVYLWGTLVQGEIGQSLIIDSLRLAAQHARLGGEAVRAAVEEGRRAAGDLAALAETVRKLDLYPERSYFERTAALLARQVDFAVKAAELGNVSRSRELLASAQRDGELLRKRLAAAGW